MRWLLLALLLVICPGCELPGNDVAIPVNFSLTGPVLIVIVLAYLSNSRGHLASVGSVGLQVLRSLGVIRPATDKVSIAGEEIGKTLAETYLKFQGNPKIQEGILELMKPSNVPKEPAK